MNSEKDINILQGIHDYGSLLAAMAMTDSNYHTFLPYRKYPPTKGQIIKRNKILKKRTNNKKNRKAGR